MQPEWYIPFSPAGVWPRNDSMRHSSDRSVFLYNTPTSLAPETVPDQMDLIFGRHATRKNTKEIHHHVKTASWHRYKPQTTSQTSLWSSKGALLSYNSISISISGYSENYVKLIWGSCIFLRFSFFYEFIYAYYAMLFSYIFKTQFLNMRCTHIKTTEYEVAITYNLLSSYYSKRS